MLRRPAAFAAFLMACSLFSGAADLRIPDRVAAATELKIATTGNGGATLYIAGPASSSKRTVQLGDTVTIPAGQLRYAGRYTAVLKSGEGERARSFYVVAAAPASLSFLAQPSRVPTSRSQVISGTAFVFDQWNNLVMAPAPVRFELAVEGSPAMVRQQTSKDGIAWTRMDSARKEGAAQFVASSGAVSVRRVIQQVAAEPCNLRMRAAPDRNGIAVETDPIRDCAGNSVPDGTIVTFTQVDQRGKTTVDAVIKRGIARAELPPAERAVISVASGVVVGNEIHWGDGR